MQEIAAWEMVQANKCQTKIPIHWLGGYDQSQLALSVDSMKLKTRSAELAQLADEQCDDSNDNKKATAIKTEALLADIQESEVANFWNSPQLLHQTNCWFLSRIKVLFFMILVHGEVPCDCVKSNRSIEHTSARQTTKTEPITAFTSNPAVVSSGVSKPIKAIGFPSFVLARWTCFASLKWVWIITAVVPVTNGLRRSMSGFGQPNTPAHIMNSFQELRSTQICYAHQALPLS
ncbi:hypothetical protein BDR26DRAFT_899830 [Obelidium mucronatum]|nr:hypothetical protein BDR26DRAFT_899830 [Obelidium mucronatum]